MAISGTAAGGVLAYGNYNPVFRNRVDQIVPGFGALSDKAADVWVNVTDYFNPKPVGTKKKDELVIEHNEAKVKARLDELKKPKTSPSPLQKEPEGADSDVKSDSSLADQKKEKKSGKGAGESTKVKPKVPEQAPVKKSEQKKQETKSDKAKEKEHTPSNKKSEAKSGKKQEMKSEERKEEEKIPKGEEKAKTDALKRKPEIQRSSALPPDLSEADPAVAPSKKPAGTRPKTEASEEKPTKPKVSLANQ